MVFSECGQDHGNAPPEPQTQTTTPAPSPTTEPHTTPTTTEQIGLTHDPGQIGTTMGGRNTEILSNPVLISKKNKMICGASSCQNSGQCPKECPVCKLLSIGSFYFDYGHCYPEGEKAKEFETFKKACDDEYLNKIDSINKADATCMKQAKTDAQQMECLGKRNKQVLKASDEYDECLAKWK